MGIRHTPFNTQTHLIMLIIGFLIYSVRFLVLKAEYVRDFSATNLHVSKIAVTPSPGPFNMSLCPSPWEIQTEKVQKSFDHTKMLYTYYELAFQDITQYPACRDRQGGPQCVQANKTFVPDIGPYGMIDDEWTLQC